jgi:glycine/D-amino acid oxidase-like deaminating enzyme
MDVKSASGKIGVVGTGVIGAGWAAYFLAKGFDVFASDPAEGAETPTASSIPTPSSRCLAIISRSGSTWALSDWGATHN